MDIFQDVFDCSPKPVIAVNASGHIQYANSAAVDLFFPGGDFSGAQLAEINDSVNSSAKTTGKNTELQKENIGCRNSKEQTVVYLSAR